MTVLASDPTFAEQWGPAITAAGVFAAALVAFAVGYFNRRQTEKHWRITSRRERFTTIAGQLADPNPAVRIAGVYAMEALTNDWLAKSHWYSWRWTPGRHAGRREAQACINVLCAYLRLPYTPPPGATTVTKQVVTTRRGRTTARNTGATVETHHEYRNDDRLIRSNIVNLMAENVRSVPRFGHKKRSTLMDRSSYGPSSRRQKVLKRLSFKAPEWSYLDFDLENVRFLDAVTFDDAHFRGALNLRRAKFDAMLILSYSRFGVVNLDHAEINSALIFENVADLFFCSGAVFRGHINFTYNNCGALHATSTHHCGATSILGGQFKTLAFFGSSITGALSVLNVKTDAAYFGLLTIAENATFQFHGVDCNDADFTMLAAYGSATFSECTFGQKGASFERPRAWSSVEVDWEQSTSGGAGETPRPNVLPKEWPPVVEPL